MTTIYKIENSRTTPDKNYVSVELRGLSTEEKPLQVAGKYVDNGSVYIEIDTGKLFFFDLENEQWKGE